MLFDERLSLIFGALADATRRGILEQLAHGECNISQLGERYEMSQPAISKHLKVLDRAGLIKRSRRGREHLISVNTEPVEEAMRWIDFYTRQWKDQFDAVDEYLKKAKGEPK